MNWNQETDDRIQTLWDDMADFDATNSDAALEHLLEFLCSFLAAQNVSWLISIRLSDIAPDDPILGWRPRSFGFLRPDSKLLSTGEKAVRGCKFGEVDASTIRNGALAGRWRANRLVDLVEPSWFESEFYRLHYLACNRADAIWVGCPINADTELFFGIFRSPDHPRFSEEERDMAGAALRGLKWFYRNFLLSHGFRIANAPLTTTERKVLQGLLAGQTEKQIARHHGQSPHTTHDHVKAIYRKFGITNRATLLALWLGHSP